MTQDQKSMNTQRHEEDSEIYTRCLLYYLICRCAFNARWTPHVSQLSLCLSESSVCWENVTFSQSKVTRK